MIREDARGSLKEGVMQDHGGEPAWWGSGRGRL